MTAGSGLSATLRRVSADLADCRRSLDQALTQLRAERALLAGEQPYPLVENSWIAQGTTPEPLREKTGLHRGSCDPRPQKMETT